MNIDNAIRIFANFMNNSWEIVLPLLYERNYTSNDDSINDWLQSNWELLVERKVLQIGEYLEIYGEGADFYGAVSRITDQNESATFKVCIESSKNEKIFDVLNNHFIDSLDGFEFLKLVSFSDGFYKIEPKFNFALVEDSNKLERVVSIENIRFELKQLN